MSGNETYPRKDVKYIQESLVKKGGSSPKPSTPKPPNVTPPSQKPKK